MPLDAYDVVYAFCAIIEGVVVHISLLVVLLQTPILWCVLVFIDGELSEIDHSGAETHRVSKTAQAVVVALQGYVESL